MPGYISEVDYDGGAGSNFIEIAIPKNTDTSAYTVVIYGNDGTVIETFSLGPVVNTLGGHDVYLIDDNNPDWIDLLNNEAIALVDDTGTVLQFIAFKDPVTAVEGPADGMSATQIGEHSGGDESLVTGDDGASYSPTPNSDPGVIPCFAPGTLIDTPVGPRAVEDLRVGGMVSTLDHGPQVIRWLRSSDHALDAVHAEEKPVLIAAGALGRGRPSQDMIVSPQHRIFVGGGRQLQGRFAAESLAPAKSLTALRGIRHMRGKKRITWIHFACDRHEVVLANGCYSESLLLGPMVLNGLTDPQRQALTAIYGPAPTPEAALSGPPARGCLDVGTVLRHLAACIRQKGQPAAREIRKWDHDLVIGQNEVDHPGVVGSADQEIGRRIAS